MQRRCVFNYGNFYTLLLFKKLLGFAKYLKMRLFYYLLWSG